MELRWWLEAGDGGCFWHWVEDMDLAVCDATNVVLEAHILFRTKCVYDTGLVRGTRPSPNFIETAEPRATVAKARRRRCHRRDQRPGASGHGRGQRPHLVLCRAPSASLLDLRKRVPFEQLCQFGGGWSFPRDPYTALRRRPRESDAAMRAFAVGSALKRPGEVPASPSFSCQIHVGGGTQRQNNKGQARSHSATRIVRSVALGYNTCEVVLVQHLRGCIARLGPRCW